MQKRFPRKSTQTDKLHDRVFLGAKAEAAASGLRSKYSPLEFANMLKELETAAESDNASTAKAALANLETLRSYREVNTLYYSCMEHLSRLTSVGPYQLDERRISATDLYDIISEASLLLEDVTK